MVSPDGSGCVLAWGGYQTAAAVFGTTKAVDRDAVFGRIVAASPLEMVSRFIWL